MFNPFKKKSSQPQVESEPQSKDQSQLKPEPQIRDVLFGDVPISQWPKDSTSPEAEPWASFVEARTQVASGRTEAAVEALQRILAMPDLESRHYLQAWHFLRQAGIQPDPEVSRQLHGVIVEFTRAEGLFIVAAYADLRARCFHDSGAAVVWEAPRADTALDQAVRDVLSAGKVVSDVIGVWEQERPPAPSTGQARINMLTPGGLRFGQGPFDVLAGDALGGPVISAAVQLMQALTAKSRKG
jgi:hypothetical protein